MVLFWHRRDLRVEDNAGLFKALKENDKVQPIFIFDQNILAELPSNDQRVRFIHQEIQGLKLQYQTYGSDLKVYVGNPKDLILKIATEHLCTKVYTNRYDLIYNILWWTWRDLRPRPRRLSLYFIQQ